MFSSTFVCIIYTNRSLVSFPMRQCRHAHHIFIVQCLDLSVCHIWLTQGACADEGKGTSGCQNSTSGHNKCPTTVLACVRVCNARCEVPVRDRVCREERECVCVARIVATFALYPGRRDVTKPPIMTSSLLHRR